MKVYIFSGRTEFFKEHISGEQIRAILERVAKETDTTDLVVALYFDRRCTWTGGTAYVRSWMTPDRFRTGRGKWKLTTRFPKPADLPKQYKLIRMYMQCDSVRYPLTEMDRYHWKHSYPSIEAHIAHLFAHELHHFRRYHLDLHPGEGENRANQWAKTIANNLGYAVESQKIKIKVKKRRKKQKSVDLREILNPNDFLHLDVGGPVTGWVRMMKQVLLNMTASKKEKYVHDKMLHFEKLRSLPEGSVLKVSYDPSEKYCGQNVSVVRPLKRNSYRIVIQTGDGKVWRWPMAWLKICE